MTDKDLNYDNLAAGLKAALQNDISVFDVDRLQKYTGTYFLERISLMPIQILFHIQCEVHTNCDIYQVYFVVPGRRKTINNNRTERSNNR